MVKSLDEQIKSLQERQAQLKARENDLMARRRERERRARTKRLIEVGAMAESAAGFEGGDERAKERIARLVQLGSLVEAMCSTDVMDNYTSREDLKTTVTKALEHNVRTSDGMNWNLHDLVYEALSEEWGQKGRRDQRPLGGRRAKRIPATLIRAGQPRTQDSPNTLRWPDLTSKKRRRAPFLNLLKSFYILLGPPQPLETLGSEDVTGDKKGANRGQKGSEPGTKRERTGDKKGANRGRC